MFFKFRNCYQLLKLFSSSSVSSSSISFQVTTISDLARTKTILTRKMATATGLIDFIHSSPTPFHLVDTAGTKLTEAGFTKLDERDPWSLNKSIVAGGKYFYSRNRSTIVAFTVGSAYTPGGAFKVDDDDIISIVKIALSDVVLNRGCNRW